MRYQQWATRAFSWFVALSLAACGGGDGGGSSGPALTFEPAALVANFRAGQPLPITVTATALHPEDFKQNVYVVAVDEKQVIQPYIGLSALSANKYSATITPSAVLAAGHYTGTLSIRLCKDLACTSQFPGSPIPLPYDFTVQAVSAAVTFEPSTLAANFRAGLPMPISVTATATYPDDFKQKVYAVAIDEKQVIQPNIALSALPDGKYSARLTPSALLAAGHYTGTLAVRLCWDIGCASQIPGSPVALPYDFNVQEAIAALNFSSLSPTAITTYSGEAKTRALTLRLTGDKLRWNVGSSASWLQVGTNSGTGAQDIVVTVNSDDLLPGDYKARITATTEDGQSAGVDFTLQHLERQFVLNGGVPSFTMVNGSVAQAQALPFTLNNQQAVNWSASTTAAWMQLSPTTGVTPGTITLQPDPTQGPLKSGKYSADISLNSPNIASKTVTSQLTLMAPTLSTNTTALVFGGAKGREFSAQMLSIGLNTNIEWPWSLTDVPAWLLPGTTSGKASTTSSTQAVSVDALKAPIGTQTSVLTVRATVNGETVSKAVTVTINADQRRLLPSVWGVGLASTPTGQVLSRNLQVRDNFDQGLAWTAASDATWLTVTNSGRTDGASQLVVTADPSGLPNGQLSQAKVTLSSSQTGVAPAVIRVALWKDATGAVAMQKLPLDRAVLVADTIRPYVYTHVGGSDVDVYNAYTGQKVTTLINVGAALGAMAVSPDGSLLYAADTANRVVKRVNLDTGLTVDSWALSTATTIGDTALVVRTSGVDVLVMGDGGAYAAGRRLGKVGSGESHAATPDGRTLLWQNIGLSPASAGAVSLDYSEVNGGTLMASDTKAAASYYNGSSNGRDIAVSPDGTRIYTATGAPYRCTVLAGSDMSVIGSLPGGDNYPNNVEVTSDGRIICGISGWYSSSDFWVHSSTGALIQGYKVAGYAREIKARQMVVTPDGLIVATLTDDPVLAFVAIGR